MVISSRANKLNDGKSVWEFVVPFEMELEEFDAKKLFISFTKLEKDPVDMFALSIKVGILVLLSPLVPLPLLLRRILDESS